MLDIEGRIALLGDLRKLLLEMTNFCQKRKAQIEEGQCPEEQDMEETKFSKFNNEKEQIPPGACQAPEEQDEEGSEPTT